MSKSCFIQDLKGGAILKTPYLLQKHNFNLDMQIVQNLTKR